MSLAKVLAVVSIFLFGIIGVAALIKTGKSKGPVVAESFYVAPVEVELDREILSIETSQTSTTDTYLPLPAESTSATHSDNSVAELQTQQTPSNSTPHTPSPPKKVKTVASEVNLPDANRIGELFMKDSKLPIVQTITYKSRVQWQKGRPAWLSDYASHYGTSRHFIARSLNGKPDYFKMDVAEGNRFNVFKADKKFNFYLLVDSSLLKMWFFYQDLDDNNLVLLKTYRVGLGRFDPSKESGSLTPIGKYLLGDKVAIYKPNVKGIFKGEKVEMIRVFGTRWIPFERELEGTTLPAKGFGIHGTPWTKKVDGVLDEDNSSIGKNDSDGCVRLNTNDMEELFAIVITKPTTIEIVNHFSDAKLPAPIK